MCTHNHITSIRNIVILQFVLTGHRCNAKGCGNVLVLDGNQKNNRPVCAADGAGYTEYTGLPGTIRTGCLETPEQQSKYCGHHKPRVLETSSVGSTAPQVVEMLLGKKQTRNSTFYEVNVLNWVAVLFWFMVYFKIYQENSIKSTLSFWTFPVISSFFTTHLC